MKWAALVLVAACAAAPPRAPRTTSSPVPGTLWITPAQPWRLPRVPHLIAGDGATALVAAHSGWVARIDLATGALLHERTLPGLDPHQLVRLAPDRWLVVGKQGGRTVAATLDPATLEPAVVVRGTGAAGDGLAFRYLHGPGAAVLDEGLAIAGFDLPLAIYDPATWQVRRVVDPKVGWSRPAGGGTTLFAGGKGGLFRFDLATGTQATLAEPMKYVAARDRLLVTKYEKNNWVIDLVRDGAPPQRFGTPFSYDYAIEPSGARLAVRDVGRVLVYSLPDGALLATHDLGDSGHAPRSAIAFADNRLLVSLAAVVRVIDLATGAITPAGDAPYGLASALSVDAAGTVLYLGTHAVQVANGAVVVATRPRAGEVVGGGPHDVTSYAMISKPDAARLELFVLGRPAPVRTWKPADSIHNAWLGASGTAVVMSNGFESQRALYRTAATELEKLTPINFDATMLDVDPDAGIALVAVEGTLHVVDARASAVLHEMPQAGCDEFATARLERGGDRFYTFNDGGDIFVYRRSTGALIGGAHYSTFSAVFVPGRDELALVGSDTLALWNPRTGELRERDGLAQLEQIQVSPDAKRIALAFRDGRIALADLDVLRAALPVTRAEPAQPAADCKSGDPFKLDAPTDIDAPGAAEFP